jgi:hypothetical protein
VAVIGLLGAIWALSGAPKPWEAAAELTATEVARANTQIILDTSAGMGKPFGDGTKLDAAVGALKNYVVPLEQEGLSLRRTGRSCDEGGERLVDFGTGHADDVVEEADELRPEGESNLAYAVIEAITEFAASDRFEGPASTRQVVIIADAPGDECIDAQAEIKRRLESSGIEATFKLVALKASKRGRERMKNFVAALGQHTEVEFVETEEELEEVVEDDLQRLSAEIGDLPLEQLPEGEVTETTEIDGETGEGEEGELGSDVGSEEGGELPPSEGEGGFEGEAQLAPPPEESAAPPDENAPVP